MQPKRNPRRTASAVRRLRTRAALRRSTKSQSLVPPAEMDALFEDVLLANDLAYDGLVERGRAYLEARLNRAQGLSSGGDVWAGELVSAYSRVLTQYCRGSKW